MQHRLTIEVLLQLAAYPPDVSITVCKKAVAAAAAAAAGVTMGVVEGWQHHAQQGDAATKQETKHNICLQHKTNYRCLLLNASHMCQPGRCAPTTSAASSFSFSLASTSLAVTIPIVV
jgi:hypothetical protein